MAIMRVIRAGLEETIGQQGSPPDDNSDGSSAPLLSDGTKDYVVHYWVLYVYISVYLGFIICLFLGLMCLTLYLICSGLMNVISRAQERHELNRQKKTESVRARMLQAQYGATRCPICLEEFQQVPSNNSPPAERDDDDDGDNKKLLADDEASESSPLLRSTSSSNSTMDHPPACPSVTSVTTNTMGSDGRPLKLLRCGHVFDQTCWDELRLEQKSTCPICRRSLILRYKYAP